MSVRLVTFSAFSISSLINGPSTMKFHMLILEMGPHNRSGPNFALFYFVKLMYNIFLNLSCPSVHNISVSSYYKHSGI